MREAKIIAMFELANQAKKVREYKIANIIFGVMVEEVLCGPEEGQWEIGIETNDPAGYNGIETYYDLLCLSCEIGQFEGDIRIPLEMISTPTLGRLLKRGVVTYERRDHQRVWEEATTEMVNGLYERLSMILSESDYHDAQRILGEWVDISLSCEFAARA